MSGAKSGVAQQIKEEPRALYTHCYSHSLNLAASDAIKASKSMSNALDTTYEIVKLRLNSLIILHVHKGQTDSLNLTEVANELENRNIDQDYFESFKIVYSMHSL